MCVRIFFVFFSIFVLTFALVFLLFLKCPRWVFLGLRSFSVLFHILSSFFGKKKTKTPISTLYHLPPSLSLFTPSLRPFSLPFLKWKGDIFQSRAALHLSASIATLAFCSAPAWGFTPVGQAGQGCMGGCPWVQSPCGGCGTLGTFGETPQPPTWGGGGEVAMEAAMGLPPLPLLKLSDAFSRENMVNASGKLGGVAGVLAGVHIWEWGGTENNECTYTTSLLMLEPL